MFPSSTVPFPVPYPSPVRAESPPPLSSTTCSSSSCSSSSPSSSSPLLRKSVSSEGLNYYRPAEERERERERERDRETELILKCLNDDLLTSFEEEFEIQFEMLPDSKPNSMAAVFVIFKEGNHQIDLSSFPYSHCAIIVIEPQLNERGKGEEEGEEREEEKQEEKEGEKEEREREGKKDQEMVESTSSSSSSSSCSSSRRSFSFLAFSFLKKI